MIDFKSVSIRGVFNAARARVLWKDGVMRVWGVKGFLFEVPASEPRRVPGHLGRWDSETERGPIQLRFKCLGCGGRKWWSFMRIDQDELWGSA